MKTIATLFPKGGTGKTTLSSQLAWGLARRGFRTLVIDIDNQGGNVTAALGAIQADPFEYNAGTFLLKREIPFAPLPITERLDLVPCDYSFTQAERDIELDAFHNPGGHVLAMKALHRIQNQGYDFAIFDCPPRFNIVVSNVLMATDLVLSPVAMDRLSVMSVRDVHANLISRAQHSGFDNPPVLFIPTFWKANTTENNAAFATAKKLCARPGCQISSFLIPDATAIARATSASEPIWHPHYNDSPAAQNAFSDLVDYVLDTIPPEHAGEGTTPEASSTH